ncbi:enoyl-CoA hydratase/isomerase family protein [Dactylosporangium sp. NPDC051485]|uniref:enoyl-CoA hydratase/isomerase family protein n=1 Tax=Dactylosporangium sp. NPDC051485 TaxID=3154846 RepID=UPI00343465AF
MGAVATAAPDLGTGVAALRRLAEDVERRVLSLPARASRTAEQDRAARDALAALGTSRRLLLDRHAGTLYATLTAGRTLRPRLDELVGAAQRDLPGLVPSEQALDADRRLPLGVRDGWEIDLGLFFGAILGDAVAGGHLLDTMRAPSPHALRLLDGFRATGVGELSTVSLARRDGVTELTVHNQHCLNAEDEALVHDMETAVDLVLLDDASRVGVLRGAPMHHPRYRGRRVFSAGLNLVDLREGRITLVGFLLRRELTYLCKIMHGLRTGAATTVQKPWVAAVDSFAIGGGAQLLLVFDHVIAADNAYLSLPAAQEGIVPGVANLRLTRAVGTRLARQLLLSGRRIAAIEPAAALLIDTVVPADAMDAAVASAARNLDAAAVLANRRMLHLAEEPFDLLRRYLSEFAVVQAERLYSADVLAKLDGAGPGRRRTSG